MQTDDFRFSAVYLFNVIDKRKRKDWRFYETQKQKAVRSGPDAFPFNEPLKTEYRTGSELSSQWSGCFSF